LKPPRLDARLRVVADCVPRCTLAADIGTDHGKLTAWLLYHGRCKRMIASDVSAASRAKARALFNHMGLSGRVTISKDEGLYALTDLTQVVIICGLGGRTMADMLEQDVELNKAMLILSPQTQLPLVRDALNRRAYRITKELVVRADGRFYQIWKAIPGDMRLTEKERALGVNLTATSSATPVDYLHWQLKVASSWQGAGAAALKRWIEEKIADEAGDYSDSL